MVILNVKMIIIVRLEKFCMQYFQAVQLGKRRANKSQMKMFGAAGFGMLTLTTKKVGGAFEPVGEEDLAAVISSQDGYVAILVDGDGFTKAQSKAVSREEALGILEKLTGSGVPEYSGERIQIWSESRPTIRKE